MGAVDEVESSAGEADEEKEDEDDEEEVEEESAAATAAGAAVMGLRTVGWARGAVELGFCSWERWVSGGYAVPVGGGDGFGGGVYSICHCVFEENNTVGERERERESVFFWG